MSQPLADALRTFGLSVDAEKLAPLAAYAALLWEKNAQLNLTRHATWELYAGRDLRDALALAPLFSPGERVLDVGSGGGVPGIPLAILRPDLELALCESITKKAEALRGFVGALDLPVTVHPSRGEAVLARERFDTVTMRAVASLLKIARWAAPCWGSVDRLLLVKGPKWVEEEREARAAGALRRLRLEVRARYPLGDGSEREGVVLELRRAG